MKGKGSRRLTVLLLAGALFLLSASAVHADEITVTAHVPATTMPLAQSVSITPNVDGMNFGAAEGSFLVTNTSEVPVLFRGVVKALGFEVQGQSVPEQLLLPGESTTIGFRLSATSIWANDRPVLEITYPDGSSKISSVAPQLFLVSADAAPGAAGAGVLILLLALLFGEIRILSLRVKVRRLSTQLA